eukprot:GHVQ01027186.1.p1 GENE.GHVQ01027186.1~~GHVQ01027186.1.p1  ORF type:complete len:572 (+),score=103.02 GHVQ01027186.1:104-1717(+)
MHAGTVAHLGICLLNFSGVLKSLGSLDTLCFVVAALAHDVGHLGRTNNFLVDSLHPLAIDYNDKSVLENFHASLTFHVMYDTVTSAGSDAANFLKHIPAEKRQVFRKRLIDLILETDMQKHFEFLAKCRVRRQCKPWIMEGGMNRSDQWLVMKMCLKAADIGHGALSWELHKQFSSMISEEFFQQGDEERARKLPVSPLCDRTTAEIPKSQVGFLNFVCLPTFEELGSLVDYSFIRTKVVTQVLSNIHKWKTMASLGEKPDTTPMAARGDLPVAVFDALQEEQVSGTPTKRRSLSATICEAPANRMTQRPQLMQPQGQENQPTPIQPYRQSPQQQAQQQPHPQQQAQSQQPQEQQPQKQPQQQQPQQQAQQQYGEDSEWFLQDMNDSTRDASETRHRQCLLIDANTTTSTATIYSDATPQSISGSSSLPSPPPTRPKHTTPSFMTLCEDAATPVSNHDSSMPTAAQSASQQPWTTTCPSTSCLRKNKCNIDHTLHQDTEQLHPTQPQCVGNDYEKQDSRQKEQQVKAHRRRRTETHM